ncbi:MAG: sigma 54-interacting transcriptional regulator [Polyangiaceae bacterium]
MAACTMPDPTPTPWAPASSPSIADDAALAKGALATIDALVASEGRALAVDGNAQELAAVAGHIARRAAAQGRRCIVADGRVADEPWRELAASLGSPLVHATTPFARSLSQAAGNAVLVVLATRPTAWGKAIAEELARLEGGPTLVVLGGPTPAGMERVTLDSPATAGDLARFYQALVEAARPIVTALADLGSVSTWWSRPASADGVAEATSLSATAAALQQRLALLQRQSEVRRLESHGLLDEAALRELVQAGRARVDQGRVQLVAPPEGDAGLADADLADTARVATFLETFAVDPWARLRAAELYAAAGDVEAAHEVAAAALRQADDAALRADLWDRFDQCLGDGLDDDQLVTYGAIALDHGDMEQALRLARRGDSERSFAVALLAGRTALARGDLRRSRAALSQALTLASDDEARATAETELGELCLVEGDRPAARAHAGHAINLTQSLATELAARNVVGKTHLADGEWQEANDHFAQDEERALAEGRQLDALRARLNRAIAVMSEGRRTEARALLESILEQGQALAARRATCFALANLSVLATLNHDYAEGLRLTERSIEEMRPLGDTLRLARQIMNLAGLRLQVGMIDEAEQALVFGRQACGANLGDALVSNMSLVVAKVHLAKGNTLGAATAVEEAIAAAGRCSDGSKLGEACRLAARVALEDGDVTIARKYLDDAARAATGPDAGVEHALLLAHVARAAGEPFRTLAEDALGRANEDDNIDFIRAAHELCFHAAALDGDDEIAAEHLGLAKRARDRVAASLPEDLRCRFLARPEMRRLAELEGRLAEEVESAPATRRSRQSRPVRRPARVIVGQSPAINALRKAIDKVGKSPATILIQGESGTGKELVADALHLASNRATGPMVKVNCAALVETLLLSELFGHEKGAFTGAAARKRGRFEQAHGGTIFLDEIGDISPKTQVALLRVLQERCFERVGGTSPIEIDVRVICATHRDLRAMVAEGTFREDLYYRLCGVTLDVPSFRARVEDLPEVAEALLERIAEEHGTVVKHLSDEAIRGLMRHDWPGNIRELDNALRAAALFAESEVIRLHDLTDNVQGLADLADRPSLPPMSGPRSVSSPTEAVYAEIKGGNSSLPDMKRALERACIERALEETGGNITQAAKLLGMKRPRVSQLVNQFARDDEEVSS